MDDLTDHLGTHLPRKPDWHCESDGFEWPCPVARSRLCRAYAARPDLLAVAMTQWMEQAIATGLTTDPEELWSRFLAWTAGAGQTTDTAR